MDMQQKIAARRAEIERERAQAEEDKRAAAEREWADRARAEKERVEAAAASTLEGAGPPPSREALDGMIRKAVSSRWTDNQRKGIGVMVAIGAVLLPFSFPWGAGVLLLTFGMYAAVRSTHRDAVRAEHPDLFERSATDGPEPTLWQKLWWKPQPPHR